MDFATTAKLDYGDFQSLNCDVNVVLGQGREGYFYFVMRCNQGV